MALARSKGNFEVFKGKMLLIFKLEDNWNQITAKLICLYIGITLLKEGNDEVLKDKFD